MSRVQIRCRLNGPLVVQGPVDIVDHEGKPLVPADTSKPNIALCRCGFSETKPFCDGSHHRHGWTQSPQE